MLQVINAEEVRDGEPRWWFVAKEDADASLLDGGWGAESLHTADRVAFKCAHGWTPKSAIVDRPAPTPTPAPGLDLDAVERAERVMTPGPWRADFADVAGPDFTVATCIGPDAEHDAAGIVALRNAAPALIAEVRALRAQVCRLVSGQAIESDALCQHHDADLAALAEVASLREKLAEAKRLGMEACEAARLADSDLMRATARIGAGGHGMATRHTNNIAATAAALEAL